MFRYFKIFLTVCSVVGLLPSAFGQIGGRQQLNFLEIPSFARLSGLGGVNISSYGNDVNMFLSNPALLSDSTTHHLALNHQFLFAQTQYSSLAYSYYFPRSGAWGMGLQYLNYGEFKQTDFVGTDLGTFSARDFALTVAKSHTLGNISMGMAAKLAQERIESYTTSAVLWDIGGIFAHPSADLRVGVVLKNVGFKLSSYPGAPPFRTPLDVQIGTSFKPAKMPLRLSLTFRQLHRFMKLDANTQISNTSIISLDGNSNNANDVSTFNKFSRHLVLGGELVFSPNFNIRIGYNFLTRRELNISIERLNLTGLSGGLMIRLKKFEFAYSYYRYHVAGATHQLSVMLNMREWLQPDAKKLVVE